MHRPIVGSLRPVLVTAPAAPVITAAEVKAHAAVDTTDDDTMLGALVDAAIAHVDGYTGILGRCLVNQSWRVDLADWPCGGLIRLPFPDVSAITSIKYYDEDNAEQTIDDANYQRVEDARGHLVRMVDDFAAPAVYDDRLDAVRVTFVAGYGAAADDVPAAIRVALWMLAAHWYSNREGQGEVPPHVMSLLAPYRRVGI